MTREEAYEKVLELRLYGGLVGINCTDALDMALDALEQEPCDVLSKIRNEFIDRYPRNYANELKLGGNSCIFSLNEVLKILDKYAAESEVQNADSD